MTRPKKITAAKIAAQLDPCRGNLAAVALRLTCSRRAIYDVVMRDEDLQLQLFQTREARVDLAESLLDKHLFADDWRAIAEVLHSSHGRKRGWGGQDDAELTDRVQALEDLAKLLELGAYDDAGGE